MFLKRPVIFLFLLLIFVLSGCNLNGNKGEIGEDKLTVSSISIALGGSDDLDTTVVSYDFNLWNGTGNSIKIKSVEPILTMDLQNRLTDNDIEVEINKQVNSKSSEVLSGTFKLNTKGLNKQEIINLDIHVKEFKVTTEQVVETNIEQ